MLIKHSVLSSSSVKLKLSISKIRTLFADLFGTPRLKICLKQGILLRFMSERMPYELDYFEPYLKSEHSLGLQIIF